MDAPFSFRTREAALQRLATEPLDLLIVGGGATGTGTARDAAMRGLRVGLVEQGDFGSGTSSRSSRLIHGGLRYLEHGHLRLVFEACRERRTLLRIAPHLVWPRSFLFPIHRGSRVPRWRLAAGLWLYDLLALFRNVRHHRMLSKRSLLSAEPGLRAKDLLGGARYYDAQCDDARLALANARDAHRHGGLVVNYARVDHVDAAGGRVGGVRISDLVTGGEHTVRALAVVNATGPWSDAVQGTEHQPTLHRTKGIHIVVSRERLGNREAVTHISPLDGRVMFVVPWGCLSYIGTTESEFAGSPETADADTDDVVYLLRSVNALFPEARLTAVDVKATWAGIRPLVRAADAEDPNAVSREHAIIENEQGLISIVGGKLTTFRAMAAELVDYVAQRLHEHDGRPIPPRAPTDREPLPGGEARDLDVLIESTAREGFDAAVATHLVHTYGSETPAIARLALSDPQLAQPVVDDHPTLWAELVHAMRREMAITLGDLLIRRTHLFYVAPERILKMLPAIADVVGQEMEWDATRREAELTAYRYEAARSVAFRAEARDAEQ